MGCVFYLPIAACGVAVKIQMNLLDSRIGIAIFWTSVFRRNGTNNVNSSFAKIATQLPRPLCVRTYSRVVFISKEKKLNENI